MNLPAKIITLRNLTILRTLGHEQLEYLASHAEYQIIPKNKVIYEVGELMKNVYIVEKGSIKLGMIAEGGQSLTKNIVYDNEIFGENIFTEDLTTKEFAESMMETKVIVFPIEVLKTLILQNNAFAAVIMNIIVTKLQYLEERLQNFVFKKAKERIVDFIYRTGIRKGIKIGLNECLIDHGMSHKEIAFLTDTSRQTVARILNELKKENFIHYGSRKSSKILIRDMHIMQHYRMVG